MSIKSSVYCLSVIMFFCGASSYAIPLGGSKGEWFPKDVTIKGKTTIGATQISTSTLFVAGVVESTAGFKCPDGTVLTSTATLGGGSSPWTTSGSNIYYTAGKVSIGTTTASEFPLTLGGDGGIIAKGTFGSGADLATSGEGTRMMWYPKKAAFRAGHSHVNGSWDDANIGQYSTAMGFDTRASGNGGSTAIGYQTTASGNNGSTAMGWATTASGEHSTAMGAWAQASGGNSTAMGYQTHANGAYSVAMGDICTASGSASIVMGQESFASGEQSTAMGYRANATGWYSVAMGFNPTASGQQSVAMGGSTNANGLGSTAMGIATTANGSYSTAMGEGSMANGNYSTAMGYYTSALET